MDRSRTLASGRCTRSRSPSCTGPQQGLALSSASGAETRSLDGLAEVHAFLSSRPPDQRAMVRDSNARQCCRVCTVMRSGDYVLELELLPLWVALVLSALIHFGVARVLAEQLWVMRDATLTDATKGLVLVSRDRTPAKCRVHA